jgi:hypothetical protein
MFMNALHIVSVQALLMMLEARQAHKEVVSHEVQKAVADQLQEANKARLCEVSSRPLWDHRTAESDAITAAAASMETDSAYSGGTDNDSGCQKGTLAEQQLRKLFPEIDNVSEFLFLAMGDVAVAACMILDVLASDVDDSAMHMMPTPLTAGNNGEVTWGVHPLLQGELVQNLKERMRGRKNEADSSALTSEEWSSAVDRYMMTGGIRAGGHNPHMSQVSMRVTVLESPTIYLLQVVKPKQKVLVRWRDDRVVSHKGEKFIVIPKETPEQVRSTSVNLAWIKRKRKGGIGGGKIS